MYRREYEIENQQRVNKKSDQPTRGRGLLIAFHIRPTPETANISELILLESHTQHYFYTRCGPEH